MKRKYDARSNALHSPEFKASAKAVLCAFGQNDIALIGGLAVAYHANPPVTVDADFLVLGTCGDILEQVEEWFSPPWQVSTLAFKGEIPEHCVRVERKGGAAIDFLPTGRNAYLRSVVERAAEVDIGGTRIPVALVEDVIVLKTIAGRYKDIEDIAVLGVKLGDKIDRAYIRRVLSGLASHG